MAWTSPRTWVSTEVVSAATMNTHVRDNLLATAPGVASSAGLILATAANTIAVRSPGHNTITTSESTSSSTYTDLTTAGPSVTTTTGSTALILFSARMTSATSGTQPTMTFNVTGSTTISSSQDHASTVSISATNEVFGAGQVVVLTALNAGSNTFKNQYADLAGAGTVTFSRRRLTVIPLN